MKCQSICQWIFLVLTIVVALVAATKISSVTVWTSVFVLSGIGAAATALLLLGTVARRQRGDVVSGVPTVVPGHLRERLAERISEANGRLDQAKQKLLKCQTAASAAEQELDAAKAANPRVEATVTELHGKLQQCQRDLNEAKDSLEFEKSQLDKLMSAGGWKGILDQVNWASLLQYFIFGSLASYVLFELMKAVTSSPPPGTTPRGLITLLISVVVVGIALILVLSTVVSEKYDEKRFAQGKEVLTALLGVLGTIVGFYFGAEEDSTTSSLTFEPAVVATVADHQIEVRTTVVGGRAPYFYETTLTPADIADATQKTEKTDGPIVLKIDTNKVKQESDVTVLIVVTDSGGNTGRVEYKKLIPAKPSQPATDRPSPDVVKPVEQPSSTSKDQTATGTASPGQSNAENKKKN